MKKLCFLICLTLLFILCNKSFCQENDNPKTSITWIGIDKYWNNVSNWSSNTIPTSSDNVIIPGSPTGGYYPLSNNSVSAECNNITIEAGAQLTVPNDKTMHVYGDLTLKCSSSDAATGSLIEYGNMQIEGNVTIERYYTVNGKWQYIASPLNTANSDMFTRVTSNGNFNVNFMSYDETYNCSPDPNGDYTEWMDTDLVNAWTEYHGGETGASLSLSVGQGYAFYNDQDVMINYTGVGEGVLSSSNLNIPVTLTQNDGNDDYYDGWNLVGNPYPCAIDWNKRGEKGDVHNTVYFWDGDSENYIYYNAQEGEQEEDAPYVVNGDYNSRYIPAGQAFFVKASSNGNYTVSNKTRVHASKSLLKKEETTISTLQYIKLSIQDNNYKDETILRFIDTSTVGFDADLDAYKLPSPNIDVPQIFTLSGYENVYYAINSIPSPENSELIIPLAIRTKDNSEITISLTNANLEGINITLCNSENNDIIDLTNVNEYTFNYSGGLSKDLLYLKCSSVNSEINKDDELIFSTYPNPASSIVYISNINKANYIEIYDISGKIIYSETISSDQGNRTLRLDISELESGIKLIKIYTKTGVYTKKIVKI